MRSADRDNAVLLLIAAALVIVHTYFNARYGFHRDELATIADAKNLAWGYVAYPPITPLFGRLSLELFGNSLRGIRFFPAVAISISVVVGALIARELGGRLKAQVLTALAIAAAPVASMSSSMFQYVSFDYLWWVLVTYLLVRIINSDDPRWWVAIGAVFGLGMMTKYTMALLSLAVVGAVLLTPLRRHLRSNWLWIGVALSLLIWLPNVLWQAQHHFISRDFLHSIHERDVRIGRTKGFLPEQLFVPSSLFLLPLWVAGLYYFLFRPDGKRYRALAIVYLLAMLMFVIAKGRSYYSAPLYPMLIAGGAVLWTQWLSTTASTTRRLLDALTCAVVALSLAFAIAFFSPSAAVHSRIWKLTSKVQGDWAEEIGWPEFADTVAGVFHSLPSDEQSRAGILTANYGEAGALDVYGPARGLPLPISGINSYYYRGYANAPQTLVVVGFSQRFRDANFERCELAATFNNNFKVANEETKDHPEIFVCRNLKQSWPEFWSDFHYFG